VQNFNINISACLQSREIYVPSFLKSKFDLFIIKIICTWLRKFENRIKRGTALDTPHTTLLWVSRAPPVHMAAANSGAGRPHTHTHPPVPAHAAQASWAAPAENSDAHHGLISQRLSDHSASVTGAEKTKCLLLVGSDLTLEKSNVKVLRFVHSVFWGQECTRGENSMAASTLSL
jgi:hypothetical protein